MLPLLPRNGAFKILNSDKTRTKTDLEQQNASHNSSHLTALTDNALQRIVLVHQHLLLCPTHLEFLWEHCRHVLKLSLDTKGNQTNDKRIYLSRMKPKTSSNFFDALNHFTSVFRCDRSELASASINSWLLPQTMSGPLSCLESSL